MPRCSSPINIEFNSVRIHAAQLIIKRHHDARSCRIDSDPGNRSIVSIDGYICYKNAFDEKGHLVDDKAHDFIASGIASGRVHRIRAYNLQPCGVSLAVNKALAWPDDKRRRESLDLAGAQSLCRSIGGTGHKSAIAGYDNLYAVNCVAARIALDISILNRPRNADINAGLNVYLPKSHAAAETDNQSHGGVFFDSAQVHLDHTSTGSSEL